MNNWIDPRQDGLFTLLRRRHPVEPEHHYSPLAQEARSRRVRAHLEILREPLAGLDLDSQDQATLTWLADRDSEAVAAVRGLLERARAAPPISG